MEWDVFISHASEDKESFVLPFTELLASYGVKVWFDKFTLKIGDSLINCIDGGLANSKFGLVVLSKAFFEKGWTDYELRGLLTREIGYRKVILPIWHGISKDDIIKIKPSLADKFAISTLDGTINDIALKIIEVIRPDIYENYLRIITYQNLKQQSHFKAKAPSSIINPDRTFRHDTLSLKLLLQIKLIQRTFFDILPISFEVTVNNFMKDTNPEREVLVWLRMAATYLEFINFKEADINRKKHIFSAVLKISMSCFEFDVSDFKSLTQITLDEAKQLFNIYNSIVPGVEYFDTEIYGTIEKKE